MEFVKYTLLTFAISFLLFLSVENYYIFENHYGLGFIGLIPGSIAIGILVFYFEMWVL